MAESQTDEFAASIIRLADTYKLEGDERDDFIHQHMTKAGYQVTRSYTKPQGDGKNGSGSKPGWFKD